MVALRVRGKKNKAGNVLSLMRNSDAGEFIHCSCASCQLFHKDVKNPATGRVSDSSVNAHGVESTMTLQDTETSDGQLAPRCT